MSKQYPLDLNIRLKPPRGADVDKETIREVLRSVVDEGTVPRGWKFAAISWRNPDRASKGWKSGRISDLDSFLPMLRSMGIRKLMESFRVGAVGGPKKVREHGKAVTTRTMKARIRRAEATEAEALRDYGEAVRRLARSKRAETRQKWTQAKREARARAVLARDVKSVWQEAIEGEVEEYEVAAEYP